jgi:hypothetical protein
MQIGQTVVFAGWFSPVLSQAQNILDFVFN